MQAYKLRCVIFLEMRNIANNEKLFETREEKKKTQNWKIIKLETGRHFVLQHCIGLLAWFAKKDRLERQRLTVWNGRSQVACIVCGLRNAKQPRAEACETSFAGCFNSVACSIERTNETTADFRLQYGALLCPDMKALLHSYSRPYNRVHKSTWAEFFSLNCYLL